MGVHMVEGLLCVSPGAGALHAVRGDCSLPSAQLSTGTSIARPTAASLLGSQFLGERLQVEKGRNCHLHPEPQ